MKNKFVFVIPIYNCMTTIIQTVNTIISQSYKDWRVILIDDVSTDETIKQIDICFEAGKWNKDKFKLIVRDEKFGEVRNTIDVLDEIDDDEIIVRLDGGDWLTDNDTLHMLNELYVTNDAAVVWTGQRWGYTDYGISGPLNSQHFQQGGTIYNHNWVSSHLKTFKAKFLKRVPKENFYDEDGNWIMIACDQAVFLPMIHMCIINKEPVGFLPNICYHYNIDLANPNLFSSDRSIKQKGSAEFIRQRGFISNESTP